MALEPLPPILVSVSTLILLIEILFIIFMLGSILLFAFMFCFAWSWGQSHLQQTKSLTELISITAIEWGAFISLLASHLKPRRPYFEAPPLDISTPTPQQIPVIFVPSLHSGPGIFDFLFWQLKRNFWNSLWPFSWKTFLNQPEFLEDQLNHFIEDVIDKTQTKRFRLISFGSSLPIVSQVLQRDNFQSYCDRWIAISSPAQLSSAMKFLNTKRLKLAYQNTKLQRLPDIHIHGQYDLLCYPEEVWVEGKQIVVPEVGHYGSLLHSITSQTILKELSG